MELAAAGVSIALFNQASRITIFPLVSITTSFVAEEDTLEQMSIKAAEIENAKLNEDHMLQDIENCSHKENNVEAIKDDNALEDKEKCAIDKHTNDENGTFCI